MAGRVRLMALGAMSAVALAGCGGSGTGSGSSAGPVSEGTAIAHVASTPITKAEFDHWMVIFARKHVPVPPDFSTCVSHLRATTSAKRHAPQAPPSATKLRARCAREYATDKAQTMRFLISSQWLMHEARELGVTVSDKEIQQEFRAAKQQDYQTPEDYRSYLQATGYTQADLLFKTKLELLPPKIEQKIAHETERSVTQAAIKRYYRKHASKYKHPASVGAYILMVQTEAEATAAKAEIESGKSFASVAKEVSIFRTSQKGGVYLTASRGTQEKGIEEAFAKAKTGALTGPVKTAAGYWVFQIKERIPPGNEPLGAVAGKIGGMLRDKAIQSALKERAAKVDAKWKARTTCLPQFTISDCKESGKA